MNSLTSSAFLAATAGLDAEERARFIAAMPGFDPDQHAVDRDGSVRRVPADAPVGEPQQPSSGVLRGDRPRGARLHVRARSGLPSR